MKGSAPNGPAHGRPHGVAIVAGSRWFVRSGISAFLHQRYADMQVIQVTSFEGLVGAMQSHAQVVVAAIDTNCPGIGRPHRLAQLARQRPDIPWVAFAMAEQPVWPRIMNIDTVYAVINHSADEAEVGAAFECAIGRRKRFPMRRPADGKLLPVQLTPRQLEIHHLLRLGASNKSIGAELGISEGTVKNHVSTILRLLNASNRTQAAQVNLKPANGTLHAGP